jgi:hypothetical protein
VPIDFAAIADGFRDPLTAQTRQMAPAFVRLAEAVKKLSEQADAAERATRAYPALRYRDGALCVRVDPAGEALLRTQEPLGFVRGLQAGGREFLAGIGWTRTAVEQELALPRILAVGGDALEAVIASIDRFATPTPGMFDPRARRLSDVLGLLVLGYNSLLGSEARDQLVSVAGGAGRMLTLPGELGRLFPAETEAAAASAVAPVGAIDEWVAMLDEKAVLVLDLVLLLPVLGDLLASLVREGSLELKRMILTELSSVEAQAVALRAEAIDGLLAGAAFGDVAARWLDAARVVVTANINVLTFAAPSLLDTLLTGTRAFAEGVTVWGRWVSGLMQTFQSINETVLRFDLLGYALRAALPGWLLDRLDIPTITVEDVVAFLLGETGTWIKDTLDTLFDAALRIVNTVGYLPWVDTDDLYWKIQDIADVCNIVLTRRPDPLPPDVMWRGAIAGFPDVYQAFFGSGREAAFLAAIDGFGAEARAGVSGAFGGAAALMEDLGTTFAREADRAAVLGSPARLRELAVDAGEMSERVFGPEAERAREDAARRSPDALALAFEDAVTSGGFALVGAAIPAYVGEMRRFWARPRPRVERPTSPHILALHGRLGGVRVPRVTVNAPRRRPDRALATLVADRFHAEVGAAYVKGRREFERQGGASPRRSPRAAVPARRRS